MELEIASPNEEKKMQMARYQAQVAPLAPPEKGMGSQMMDMAKDRAMSGALNTGQEMATSGIKPYMQKMINSINPAGSAGAGSVAGQAATNAALASTPATMGMGGAEIALAGQSLAPSLAAGAGGAGMATLATAVPYVGAGLLAGKALGLFNEGGQVGPLSTQYYKNIYNKYFPTKDMKDMGEPPAFTDRGVAKPNIQPDTGIPSALDMQLYGAALDNQAFKDIFALTRNVPQYKAEGGMTREQAMALMNNQPDPDELYNEIVAEGMTEAAQGQMPQYQTMPPTMPMVSPLSVDPLGADTTYSPYNMMRPDNVPST